MGSHVLPSASEVERAMQCEASCALPRGEYVTSAAAERGTAIHAFIAGVGLPLGYIDECTKVDLVTLRETYPDAKHEVSYVWDAKTDASMRYSLNEPRAYGSLTAWELPGTADIVCRGMDSIKVADIKTGKYPVAPAAENWQLKTLGLMAARHAGVSNVEVSIAYLKPSGKWKFDSATLDALDLDIVADDLRAMVKRVHAAHEDIADGRVPPTHPNDKICFFCPAKTCCPEWQT